MEVYKANKKLIQFNKTLTQEDILIGLKDFAAEKSSILFDSIEFEKFSHLISDHFKIENEKKKEQAAKLEEVINERNSILSNIPLGIMMLDVDMHINWANENITKMYDYEPDEIVGKNWYDVVPLMKERKQIYEKVLKGESFDFPESEFVIKEGVQFFDVHYRPIRNSAGNIKGILVIGNVFVENNELEKVLKKQKSKLIRMARIFNEIKVPLIVSNPEGFIEMVNNSACKKYKKTEKEFLNEHIINLYEPSEYKTAKKYSNLIKNKDFIEFESLHIDKNGATFPVSINITSVKTIEGKPIYRILNVKDITDRKLNEDRLKTSSENLEKLNKELKEFSYITAHDLKAPLINLKELITLLENINKPNEESEEIYDKMKQSVNQMSSVVSTLNEVITFKEGLSEKKELLYFEEVYQEVIESISEDIKCTNAMIHYDFSECETINYPKIHLESILLNLITNSIKYRKNTEAPNIEIKTKINNNNQVCLYIKDNGVGFDASNKKHKIFRLFTRLHTHVKGNGVGLYLLKSIVDSHNGNIEVDSKENKGTHFKIFLNNGKN